MRCQACGAENPSGKKFCAQCGTLLPKSCPSCGSAVGASDKFCGECGAPADGLSLSAPTKTSPTTAPTDTAAKRRQLTVMFVDLVGSTELSTRLDPEDLREVLATYHGLVSEVIRAHEGFVAQYLGDGALVYFGYPTSHEDDAERAIRAALALLAQTGGLSVPGAKVRIRIGIATGLVVVGDKAVGSDQAHEPRIMGETPNLAARLQGVAHPNSIVIAESTRQLVGSLFAYESLGAVELKGLSRAIAAWRVLAETGVDDRFRALRSDATPFIGREEELDLLLRRWHQLPDEGGKAVFISGEPGLGKSRLLAQAREMVSADNPQVVTYFCSQNFSNTAFYPVIRQIARSCELASTDTNEEQRHKLEAFLGSLSAPEPVALLSDLLSIERLDNPDPISHLSPAERRKGTFDLLTRHLASVTTGGRSVVVFEDIHWADASTLELLDLVIAGIEAHPMLLIATYRPDFQPSWAGQSQVSVVTLARLPAGQRRRLIEAVAGPAVLSPEVIEEIAQRTDGVPLFAEELTRAAVEADSDGGGESIHRKAARASSIPATLHASLLARLDRLGPTARQVAQTGAVIGREFSYDLLGSVWTGPSGELDKALDQLRTAGLVFARGADDRASFIFKHALVQDAAYSSLLRGQKHALHRAIAARLSERNDASNLAELIARHYRDAQDSELAAEWRLRAGEVNSQRSAYREALENLRDGLVSAALMPDTSKRRELELKLNIALSVPLIALYSFTSDQTTEVVKRAEELSVELGRPRPAPLLYHRSLVHFIGGDFSRVLPVARELEESMAGHPIGLRGSQHRIFAEIMLGGDVIVAKRELELILERFLQSGSELDQLRHAYTYDFKAGIVPALSTALRSAGYPDEALRLCEYGRRRATEIKHWMTLVMVLSYETELHEMRGDLVSMEACIEEMDAVAKRENLDVWFPFVSQWRAFPTAAKGNVDAGLAMFDEARAALDRLDHRLGRTFFLSLRARILSFDHRGEEALVTIEEAIAAAQSSDDKFALSELHRLRGEYLIRYRGVDAEPEAEQEFLEAIGFAQKQNALSYELRASHSLANLMRSRGDQVGALQLLETVFNRFTEGFDTVDLIAAKRTIDELKFAGNAPQRRAAS